VGPGGGWGSAGAHAGHLDQRTSCIEASAVCRIGFDSDDLTFPGSDRLIDALAGHGDPDAVAAGLRAHLAAGVNQVVIQVLSADNSILPTARAGRASLKRLTGSVSACGGRRRT
jgi:hypothetical protein